MDKFLRDAVMLWATIDPIGTLSIFLGLTGRMGASARKNIAIRATLISTGILVASVVVGQILLGAMGIKMSSFQIAGGIVLFLFGVKMVFDNDLTGSVSKESDHDIAVFPLAVPSIASPGAIMAAVLLTDNSRFTIGQQAATTMALLLVLAATCGLMLVAGPVHKVIGKNGASIMVKVMGLILCALAVETVINGLLEVQLAEAVAPAIAGFSPP